MIGLLLKEETQDLHDLVEEKLSSKKIMDRSFTLEDYRQLITYNYRFIKHFENVVFAKISSETADKLQLEKRRKLAFIEKDLNDLNIDNTFEDFSVLIKNEAEALGILYVMEGATLGGNIIARNLSKNPNFEGVEFNYFGCYEDQTGVLWKQFQQVLAETERQMQSADYLVGAKKAYQFLLDL